MRQLLINIEINPHLYVKNPLHTKLGKKIIAQSVLLIDEIGLEQFTFKKLATKISSAEASVYRYFNSKHQLFVYLLNWYWEWMIMRVRINTLNIVDAKVQMEKVLDLLVDVQNRKSMVACLDEEALHRIVVTEGAKAYHTKLVDEDNSEGFFLAYKRLCQDIANIILRLAPTYPYPRAMASTLVETANNNIYFAQHLPRLTDLNAKNNDVPIQVKNLLKFILFGTVRSCRARQ